MKTSIYALALGALITINVTTGCAPSHNKVDAAESSLEEAEINLARAKEDYNKDYDEFKYKSDKQILENKERISKLKEQRDNLKNEMKDGYEKTIADLEAKNNILQTRIEAAKEGGKDKWESFKREFGYDMEELGKAITDLTTNNVK